MKGPMQTVFLKQRLLFYGETAYGYAENAQTICQIPNGKEMSFAIDGEWFQLETGTVIKTQARLKYERRDS